MRKRKRMDAAQYLYSVNRQAAFKAMLLDQQPRKVASNKVCVCTIRLSVRVAQNSHMLGSDLRRRSHVPDERDRRASSAPTADQAQSE